MVIVLENILSRKCTGEQTELIHVTVVELRSVEIGIICNRYAVCTTVDDDIALYISRAGLDSIGNNTVTSCDGYCGIVALLM